MNTKLIKTPILGIKVELKAWITGREGIEIERPILDIKVDVLGKGISNLNLGEATRLSKENAIKVVVISVGGDSENVLDKVLDMPKSDYEFVMLEVDKVIDGENFTEPSATPEDGID